MVPVSLERTDYPGRTLGYLPRIVVAAQKES